VPPADDDTEGDDRVEVRGQPGRGDRQFEAARHTDERGVGSGVGGGALGSVDQAVHDLRVPGGGDDGDAQFGGVDGEFGCSGVGHVLSFFQVSGESACWSLVSRVRS
jgi:hypothetical protein